MEDIQPNCVALFCVRHRKLLLLLIVLLIPASFTATILLSNVAFSLNTDLDSFIQSDEIASLQFDAVEAAKVMEAENIANLIERLTSTEPSDEGNRRMLQSTSVQRNSATEVVLFYNATLTGDIFSEEVLRDIRKIEMGIRNLPGFDDVCYIVGDTPSCAGFKSITNFFFPYRSNNVLVFDGSGTELLPRDQGIEQLLKTSGSIWMVDKKFASNGRNSQVARAIISTGLPLEGFESKDDRAEEQQKRIDDFLINTLYPYLVAASTENVRVLWYSGSLSIHEIVSSALHDALVGSGAIAFVFVAVWFHCKSIVISAFALISIIYAFPVTYCVVAIGLEKPDLSLFVVLSVFIVVGIGADDTFLFASIWKQSRILVRRARLDFSNHHSQDGNKKPKSFREDQLKSLAFRLTWTFSHASMATLVTSCTTSASFFANLASPVVPIRDFGLFMGVLVLCNYVCIVLIIPLTLVIQEEDVVPFATRIMECLRIPTNTKPWSDSISTASVDESRNSTSNEKVPGSPQSPSSTPGLPHIPIVGEHFTIAGHPRDSRNIGYSAARYTSDHPTNNGSAQPSGRTNLGSTQPIDPTNIRSEQPSHPTNNGSSSNPGHPRVINLERAPDNFHDSDSEIELEDIPIMIDCEEGDGGYRESLQSLTSFQIEPDTRNVTHALDDISLDHESTDPIVEQHTLQERELAIARAINRIVDRASNTDEQPALDREATNLKRLLEQSENPTPKKPPLPRKPHAKRSVSERLKDKLLTRGESEAFRQVAQQGQRLIDRDEISHVISKAQGFEPIEVMMHNNVSVCIQKSSYLLIFSFLLLSVLMGYFAITQIRVSDDLPKFFAEEQNLGSIEQLQRTHFGETSGSSRVIPVVVPSCTIDPATNQCVTFTCPGREQECSGQGTCASSGACTCNSKYRGEDCSVAWTAADLKPSEALAWRAVFDEFGGSDWLECSDKRLDPCSCSRVSCIAESPGSSTHTLERVDLSGNQLSGVLSSSDLSTFAGSLAIFQNLEVVNIANNPNLIIEAGACWTSGSCGQISCTVPNEWAICSGVSPTPLPTPLPTKQPTLNPTPRPTSAPVTPAPTTESPTRSPTTKSPTRSPETKPPTGSPTRKPTANPTTSPTKLLATPAPTNTNSPTSPPSTGSPTTESPTAPPTPIPTLSPTQSPDTAAPTASLRSEANLAGGSIAPGEWIGGTPSPLPFTGATLDLGGGQTVFSVTLPFSLATASVSLTATDSAATIEITVTVPSGGLSLTDTSKGSYSQVVPFSLVSEGAVAQVAIRVVAEDGVTSKDYQVNIRRDLAICDPGCENGSCVRGECECDEGFTGSTCEVQACPGNCFGNGECVIENDIGTCDCFDGYLSNNCSIADKSLEGLPDSRTEIIGVNFGVGLFDRESGKVSYNSSFNPTLPEVQQSIVNLCAGLTDGSISADTKEYLGLRRLKRCPMASFRDYVQVYTESDFPIRAGEEVFYEHFYNFMIINPGFRTLLGLDSEGKLRRISFEIQTNIDKQSGAVAASTEYEKWEVFLQSYVAERAPNLPAPQQVSQLWARSATEIAAVNGTILAFVISASCAFAAILLFTGNLVIALWNTLTIVAIVSTLIGIMVVGMGLTLGVVEAVALSVFCGLNVDYACHLSQSYNSSNSKTRFGKMRHSLTSVGGSLLGAAFTTVVSSVFLVFCKIQVFVTFGIVLAINMFLAIVLSVFLFGSLMVRFGPVGTCGSICIIPEKPCCCNTGGSNTVDQSVDSTSSTSDRQLQHHEHDAAVEAVVIH